MYQQSLFPSQQLTFLSIADARRLLSPVEWLIARAINEPWQDFRERRQTDSTFLPMEEVDVAWWMYRHVLHRAEQLCLLYPDTGLVHHRDRQQDYFALNDDLAIVFKKIKKRFNRKTSEVRYERSNYRTPQNSILWQQGRDGGLPDFPRIIAGYELTKEMTDIRIFIGYPRSAHRGFRWIYELDRHVGVTAPTLVPVPQEPSDGRKKGFVVKPRKDAIKPGKDTAGGDVS